MFEIETKKLEHKKVINMIEQLMYLIKKYFV